MRIKEGEMGRWGEGKKERSREREKREGNRIGGGRREREKERSK